MMGSSVVPGLKPDVRQRLPFPQWLSLSYWGLVGSQVSGAEVLNVRTDLAVFPRVCTLPSPRTATLATEGQEEHVLIRKITNEQICRLAAYRDLGYLQRAICAITISSVSFPA